MLTDLGFNCMTVYDEKLQGKPDTEVAKAAKEEKRILFTLDVGFADIRKFPPGTHPGIILFRPEKMGPSFVNHFILNFARKVNVQEFASCIVVVEHNKIRIRKPE